MERNIWNRLDASATPVAYADERNLRLKRRDIKEVKPVETLRPKGHGSWPHLLSCQMRAYPRWIPFPMNVRKSRPQTPGVKQAATGHYNIFAWNRGTLTLPGPRGTRECQRAAERAEAAQ